MRRLVVNADDAGLDPATDAAILQCARHGIVRCASVVAGGPTAPTFVEQAMRIGLDLGLHINLTEGIAVAGPAPTLTDAGGRFQGPKAVFWSRAAAAALDPDEVRTEVRAQWERLCSLGVEPSHVDGHNHAHVHPAVLEALTECANELWLRVPHDRESAPESRPAYPPAFAAWSRKPAGSWRRLERFTGFDFSRKPAIGVFLSSLPPAASDVEFMVHPGRRSGSAFASSELRERETHTLCSPSLALQLEALGWQVTCFRELACASPS